MASILGKALRNHQFQSATTRFIITGLSKSEPSILSSSSPPIWARRNQIPFEDSNRIVYPNFSFGLFLNPISQNGLVKPENDDEGVVLEDDSLKIWADSVKKKRKKKMNQHKLKKLRKRLRRKT